MSMGGLIACTIISGRALGPLAQIPSLVVQWKQARIALQALDGAEAYRKARKASAEIRAVLDPIIKLFENYLGTQSTPIVAGQHVLDQEYFRRIESCNPVSSVVTKEVTTLNFLYCHEDPATAAKVEVWPIMVVSRVTNPSMWTGIRSVKIPWTMIFP